MRQAKTFLLQMSQNSISNQLESLILSTQEQLTYFKELGVELLATTPQATASIENIVKVPVANETPPVILEDPSAPTAHPSFGKTADAARPTAALFEDLGLSSETIRKSDETLEQIHATIGDCTRCPLYQGRTHVVHTEGNRKARLMFVGEAPGADEDLQARPFVGRAGQLLTKIIEAIGLKREDVLIGNINRCRPPGNRAPTTDEAAVCKPFLLREIAVVQPEVIVVLGNTAMKNLLDTREGITRLRGRFQDYKGIKVMPTFHPAYLLRDPSKKRETWDDLKMVRDYLDSNNRT
jgi:DNA polymerase